MRFLTVLPTAVLLCCWPSLTSAERLPIKNYTTADGLAHNIVNRIMRDSRGFLWFCTQEGLSRFDGYSFTNYGTGQGLPHPNVSDILETRAGDYWVATNGGLVRFNPKGTPADRVVYANDVANATPAMFVVIVPEDDDRHARSITSLLESHDGKLWCGTMKGLYRLDAAGDRLVLAPVDTGMPGDYAEQRYVNDVVEDRFGTLWIATQGGLYRRWPDGTAARYLKQDGLPDDVIHDLLIDHQGRLWLGTRYAGFLRMSFDQTHAKPSVAFSLVPHDFKQSEWINQLFETSEHKIWAATPRGLLEFIPDGDSNGRQYRIYTTQSGLKDSAITALSEDAGGSLWLGSETGAGAMKLAHSGFVTYDERDGVKAVFAIFGDRAGGVCFRGYVLGDQHASIFDGGKVDLLNQNQATYWPRFGRFDGQHLTWFLPNEIKAKYLGWVDEGVTLQSRSGEWWLANGLYHFPVADNFTQLKTSRVLAHFGNESPLGERQIWRLFEDSRQRVWISIVDSAGNDLAFWDQHTQALQKITGAVNLPSFHDDLARSFGEDHAGNVWITFNTGLARSRDGAFTFFSAESGLPAGAITDIFTDHAGRLWIASARSGLIRVDDPAAERPSFTSYTTANGLSGDVVLAINEDLYGRIYAATGQGLDRLDPATGRLRHYTTADGLASGKITAAFRDRDGWIWIGDHWRHVALSART
jgi:ligand-binding sensor domain-containing protein